VAGGVDGAYGSVQLLVTGQCKGELVDGSAEREAMEAGSGAAKSKGRKGGSRPAAEEEENPKGRGSVLLARSRRRQENSEQWPGGAAGRTGRMRRIKISRPPLCRR
jgi:hypothetical protein